MPVHKGFGSGFRETGSCFAPGCGSEEQVTQTVIHNGLGFKLTIPDAEKALNDSSSTVEVCNISTLLVGTSLFLRRQMTSGRPHWQSRPAPHRPTLAERLEMSHLLAEESEDPEVPIFWGRTSQTLNPTSSSLSRLAVPVAHGRRKERKVQFELHYAPGSACGGCTPQ